MGWNDVKLMKSDELGAIFVNEGLGQNLGRVTLGILVWEGLKFDGFI